MIFYCLHVQGQRSVTAAVERWNYLCLTDTEGILFFNIVSLLLFSLNEVIIVKNPVEVYMSLQVKEDFFH